MNAFEALADMQIPSPVRARVRAVEKRRDTMARKAIGAEKKLEEKDRLLRLYKRAKRGELKELLSGPYGKEIRGLISFMRTMTLASAPALVRVIENARCVGKLSEGDRQQVLSLVFNGISQLREKNGLSFWEDPLPGEEPKAFCKIERVLREARP